MSVQVLEPWELAAIAIAASRPSTAKPADYLEGLAEYSVANKTAYAAGYREEALDERPHDVQVAEALAEIKGELVTLEKELGRTGLVGSALRAACSKASLMVYNLQSDAGDESTPEILETVELILRRIVQWHLLPLLPND